MKYRHQILIILGSILLGYSTIVVVQRVLYLGVEDQIRDLVTNKYRTEVLIRSTEGLGDRLHGNVVNALFLDPSARGAAMKDLDRASREFQENLLALRPLLPEGNQVVFNLGLLFRSYNAFASSLLETQSLASVQSSVSLVEKLQENRLALAELFEKISLAVRKDYEESLFRLQDSLSSAQQIWGTVTLLFTLLGAVVVFFLTRRLARPLEVLTRASENLARGDLGVRVKEYPQGEPGALARAFNRMAETLEQDITALSHEVEERRILELREKRLQERLAGVLESLPLGIAALEGPGLVRHWTKVAQEITGMTSSQMEGQLLWEALPLLAVVENDYRQTLLTGLPSPTHRIEWAGEPKKILKVECFPVGTRGGTEGVLRILDVTDEEKKEAQMVQLQKMDTVGTLAGGLAHDFNNLLGAVTGSVSIMELLLEEGKAAPKELRPLMDTIQNASHRAAGIIRQLLTLAKSEVKPVFQPVDLAKSLETATQMGRSAFDKSVNISLDIPVKNPMVLGDASQLEQIFLNLMINATHAMTIMRPRGEPYGGELTVALSEVRGDGTFGTIHPGAEKISYWQISLSDTGVGMSSEVKERIFDPFFTTKDLGLGTGLGLAMVFTMVKRHLGFIDVYSELGQGTTFRIYLPKVQLTLEKNQEDLKILYGHGNILVVDDDPRILELTSRMLTAAGYTVTSAPGGKEALEVYNAAPESFDLVFLDLSMPGTSGREVFLTIKALNPQARILMTSGFSGDERFIDLRSKGLNGTLEKPFTLGKLTATVKRVLEEV